MNTYYAQMLCIGFLQNAQVPASFEPYRDSYYQLFYLSGEQITAQMIEDLLSSIRQGIVESLFITPFLSSPDCGSERLRLISQWWHASYTYGCGALIFNRERSIAFVKTLDAYSLNRKMHIEANWEYPAFPPVIFDSYEEMAHKISNLLLTGSLEDNKEQPPAPSKDRRGIDPALLFWIENTLCQVPESLEDLAKITALAANYFVPAYPIFPDWLANEPGNWSLLGELPNLKALFLPKLSLTNYDFINKCSKLDRLSLSNTDLCDASVLENLSELTYLDLPPCEFPDFSFLLSLPNLEILDISKTNFRDCSLLAKMPSLKLVHLPAPRQLLHLELLEALPMQVKTNPHLVRGKDIEPFEIIEPTKVEAWSLKPPYQVLYIDNETNTVEGLDITEDYLRKLLKKIRKGNGEMMYFSLCPFGEGEALELDMAEGWATLNYSDEEESFYYGIYNPEQAGNMELAPPEVGGQSPVPMVHATEDLELVADCVAYFIKTGKLYPGAYWAKYYD